MSILEQFLRPELVIELASTTRDDAIAELVASMAKAIPGMDSADFTDRLLEREHHSSTAIGQGVAMPHAKLPSLEDPRLVVGFSKQGVDFQSPTSDGPVHLVFMTAVGGDNTTYMKLVARLAWMLRNQDIRQRLFAAGTTEDLYELLVGS